MAEWLKEVSVGDWYRAQGDAFEIVGVDAKTEIVLVQYFDGTLEEYDFDSWVELSARPCAPPEDYSGALDIEREDYGADDDDSRSGRWDNPLDLFDRL
jgi:hypothetical protein